MSIQTITPKELQTLLEKKQATLIDVREPAEHASQSIAGASLHPLGSICCGNLTQESTKKLVIHCQKGGRGQKACEKLLKENPELTLYNLEGGIEAWCQSGLPTTSSGKSILSLDRQVQLTVGLILLAASALIYFHNINFVVLAAFMGAGLTFAGLTGTCGLAKLLAAMPWNRSA